MPDQYGNPTPLEVMNQITQERKAMLSQAQTPAQQRLVNLRFFGELLRGGMDPRMAKADEITNALNRSQTMTRFEDESALDFQIRQARAAFDDVKNVDPTTAAQISAKLTELEAERYERTLLQQREDRAQAAHEQQIEMNDLTIKDRTSQIFREGIQYAFDPKTSKLTGDWVDSNDPDMAQVQGLLDSGLVLLPAEDAIGLLDTAAADFSLWNNSGFEAQLESIDTQIRNVGVANQLAQVFVAALAEGDNPAAYFDSLERKLGGVMEGIDDLKGLTGDERPRPGDPRWQRDISAAEDFIRREGIRSGVTASLLTTLAYTRARTFDNRVTDQDFRKAYDMLGADSGDPSIIMSNLRSIIFGDAQTLFDTVNERMASMEPHMEGVEGKGRAQYDTVRNQLDLLGSYISTFDAASNSVLEAYNVGDATTGGNRPQAGEVEIGGRRMIIR